MKRLNYFFLLLTFISVLTGSCSSSKNSKGGGWYHNRNVNQTDAKEATIVFQSEEEILTDFKASFD
jgi:hypothetical protein